MCHLRHTQALHAGGDTVTVNNNRTREGGREAGREGRRKEGREGGRSGAHEHGALSAISAEEKKPAGYTCSLVSSTAAAAAVRRDPCLYLDAVAIMSTSGHTSEPMLSSILLMLWWCEGKGVAGEHRVGEGGGGGD